MTEESVVEESLNRKIKNVRMINFQNHRETYYDLTDGLNIITGSSDNGKTACARALNFAINNIHSGDVIMHGQKNCIVELEFVDGAIFRRIKGVENRVEYKNPDDKDFTVYKSFGTKYPDEVLRFLGFPPISKALGPLNYSDQHNKNFLIDQSPSALPNIISTLIGVDDLEEASKNLFSVVGEQSKDIGKLQKEIADLEYKLEEDFKTLDQDRINHDKIGEIIAEIDEKQVEINEIISLSNNLIDISSKGRKCKTELDYNVKIVDAISEYVKNIENNYTELEAINNLYNPLLEKSKKIQAYTNEINQYSKIANEDFEKLISDAELYLTEIGNIQSLNNNVENQLELISSKKDQITKIQTEIDELNTDLETTLTEIKELGLSCSECNKFGGETI
jgi:DNA repair exonuclease SbcCD ATPase subunit